MPEDFLAKVYKDATGLDWQAGAKGGSQRQQRDPNLEKLQRQLAEVDRRIASNQARAKDNPIYRGVEWVGDKLPLIDSFGEKLASERASILENIQDIERSRQRIQQTGTGEGGFSAALQRGIGNLRSTVGGIGAAVGDVDENDIQNIVAGRRIANSAPRSAEEQAVYEDFQSADGFLDSARVLFTNPKLIANIAIESLPTSSLSMLTGALGTIAGAGTGALSANPVGMAVGGRVGGSIGTGLGSFATEYGNAMLDTFVNNGVDIDDPQQLRAAISDPELMAEARERGVKRGLAVGVFDALSAGIAGKLGLKLNGNIVGEAGEATFGRKVAGTVAGGTAEVGMQGTLGGAGEAAGQIATEGRITSPQDILSEFAGEIPSGVVESGVGTLGEVYKDRVKARGNTKQREDTDLLNALNAFTAQRPEPQPTAQIEDQNTVAMRDMGTMRVGGLNLTAPQVLEFASNNTNNPRIADIMSQPVADTTKVEQVARILNAEQAARVEPEAVRRIGGMVGGTTPVSTTRQFIRDELSQIGEEVINESSVLSAIRDAVATDGKGKSFVNTLRSITDSYTPAAAEGQTFVARPERGGDGSVVMTPDQTAEEAQREREAQQAFRMAERRQQRFDQATGKGTQREDIRPGAPEPEAQFFLGDAYGDLAGTAATVVEAATPGVFRVQYDSPTETDANGNPVTISEEVPALDLVGRVVRGTPRMTQELAGDVRKPRKGTGTDMNPRQSVDRTTTRAIAEAQQPQPPMVAPEEPNLTMTGRQEQPFEAQPSLNAQENPAPDNAAPEGTVESQGQVSGAPGATALPAPPRGLPAPEAQEAPQQEDRAEREAARSKVAQRYQAARKRANQLKRDGVITMREKFAMDRKITSDIDAAEKELDALENPTNYDDHPLMQEHDAKFDGIVSEIRDAENVKGLRKIANRLVKDGVIDDTSDMDDAMDSADKGYKLEDGQEALVDLVDQAREDGRLEVETQIDKQESGEQYSGRKDRVREPRVKASEVVARTQTERERQTEQAQPQEEEESVDYESVINDRLDKIAEKGAQGRVIAKRLKGLLKDKSLSAPQLYYAIRMGEVFARVLPKNAKIDILFVPSMKATNAMAAAASGTTLGADVTGSYKPYEISQNGFRGLITMSLAEDMLSVSRENAAHEAFHVIQDMLRVYDPEMFDAINNYFKDGMRIDDLDPSILRKLKSLTLDGDRSVYQSLKDDFGDTPLGRFEAQAVAFGALVDAKDRGENMKGLKASIARFVDMLSNLRRGLRNVMRKPGSDKLVTIADVFEGFRTGESQEYLEDAPAPLADGSVDEQYSARTKADPVRTQKAYKLFRVDARKPGQLFPLFVNANDPVPMGKWLDADVGPAAGNKVKSKLGPLAMRPGWHAGDLPIATHIGAKSKASLKAPDTRPDNQVWAEVEFAADRDWQGEANSRAKRNANGEIIANTAQITDQIPEDGFYRYKTNPNMTGNWLIGGSMKVNRILSDAEVEQINKAAGVSDLPRANAFDSKKYGFEQYSGRTGNGDQGEFNKNIKPQKLSSDEIFAQPDVKQGTMNVTEAALAIQERTLNILGRAITAPGQQDELLSKTLAHEVKAELQRSGKRNASGWYTEEMRKATAVASLMHPEIASDVGAQLGFTAALAITSQNQSVDFNTVYAERWYEQYKKTGKFPENEGWGKAASSIMSNAKLFNTLVERFGAATVSKFFATKFSVRELKAAGFKNVSGAAEEMVYGSAVLGPKIGFGFYSNLNGRYDPITIDMWFMRTWGRVTGDLIGASDELVAEQQQRLINALRDEGRPTNAYGDELLEIAREEFKKFEKDFKDNRADYDSGKKVKSEVALAAQRLVGSFEDTKDAPKADWQRTWIRDVVAGAQQILQKDGINITNADFQAIIWYPEKRLWSKKYGVREKGKGADDAGSAGETSYFDEFVRIAKSRGFTDVQIQSAIQPARGRGPGSGGVLGGQAVNQQAGGQPSAANEFSAGEARRFIQDAIVTRINQDFPIFDGDGSGPVGQPSGHVIRKSGGNLARNLEGRVPVAATYSHSLKAKNAFEVSGIDAVKFHELTTGPAAAKLYHRLISEAKNANKAGAAVYVYDQADYADMRLFLSEDGLVGFALKGNDVVSVFKHPNAGARGAAVPLIRMATWLGGRKLDAYDTVLPRIYSTAGYKVAARIPWDDSQAEPTWDKKVFEAFNNGEPDVVFMVYDPTRTDFYREGEGPTAKDYDDAVARQTAAVKGEQYSARRGALAGAVAATLAASPVNASINDTPIAENSALYKALENGNTKQALAWIRQNSKNEDARKVAAILTKNGVGDQRTVIIDPIKKPDESLAALNRDEVDSDVIRSAMGNRVRGLVMVNPKNRSIYLIKGRDQNTNGVNEQTFIHESIHAYVKARWDSVGVYTSNNREILEKKGLYNEQVAEEVDRFNKLWRQFSDIVTKEWDAGKEINSTVLSAAESPNEALSYMLTNPTVQDYAKRMVKDGNGYKLLAEGEQAKRTWWDDFVDMVRKVFGLQPSAATFFDEFLNAGYSVIEAGDQANPDFAVARTANPEYSARTGRAPAAPNRPLRSMPQFTNTNPDEPSRLDDVIYNLQDKLIDVKRLQQNIEKSGKKIGEDANVYRAEELYHGRAAKRAKDFVSRELSPLIQDMKSKNISLEVFDEFLHARHAKERNAQIRKVNPQMQDGGSGMTDAEADAYMQSLPNARRLQLEKLAKRVDAIVQETQKMTVAYGLETQATIDNWNSTYKAYVPLQREGFEDDIAGSGAQGLSVRGSSSRRAMGSDLGVVDVLANVAMQRERVITRGERNLVGNAMVKLALENPNDGFWFVVDPKSKSTAMAEQKLVAFGVDPVDAKEIVGLPTERFIDPRTGRLVVRANSRVGSQPNVLATRINGEDRYVVFNARNPRAARTVASLKNLDAAQIGAVLGTIGKATRYFAAINTQYNPAFGLYNLMRDVQGAVINLGDTPLANDKAKVISHVLTAGVGMYRDLRAERSGGTATSNWAQMAEEFELAGGKTGFRDMFRNSQERADSITRELDPSRLQKIGDTTVGPVFNWLSDFNESIENSVRLSVYKVARDKGLSIEESASIAKNITVNFNRKGAIGTQTGMIYAFFNASVQGTARMAQALTGPAGKKIIAGGLLLGVMQAVALAAAGFDDDEIPDWLKDKNLVIPVGNGKYAAIPMPLGYHVIPAFARRATEFFMSDKKSAVGEGIELLGLFADAFNPIGNGGTLAETLSPTVTDPIVQLQANRDFAGRPIYNENFNSLDPTPGPERTREGASIIGEYIARAIDSFSGGNGYVPGKFSPTGDEVDFAIGTVTGGAGRTVLNTVATVKAGITGEDLPNYKIPFVGRMVGDKNEAAAVSGRFYENLKEVNGHQRTIKGMKEKGEDTYDYIRQNPGAGFAERDASFYEREVAKMKKERKELIADGDKAEATRVGEELQQLMVEFNQRYMDSKKP